MTQMWLLRWPKNTSSSAAAAKRQGEATITTITTTTTAASCSSFSTPSHCPNCLAKLVRKLKKQARNRIISSAPSRPASFKCGYDPLSYSLNFDDTSTLDEDKYNQFCAFSSRFVANPRTTSPRLVTASAR